MIVIKIFVKTIFKKTTNAKQHQQHNLKQHSHLEPVEVLTTYLKQHN